MNCFVSKQPVLGELIIIMKPSSITAAFQQLAGEPGRGWGGGAWGKRQQHPVYHFLKLLTMCLTQKAEIPLSRMLTLRCQLGRARFIHLFSSANLGVAGQVIHSPFVGFSKRDDPRASGRACFSQQEGLKSRTEVSSRKKESHCSRSCR